ncbi:hypothetical protein CcaverHIS002_0103500 [Cutaneotrichosporon cavernicola]|nr:hypothetical protein CcaverHIS002_0103500 [Cutaneotrichosporon cavernicola]
MAMDGAPLDTAPPAPPAPPRNLRSPLDRDTPARNGPLLPASLNPRAPRASYWTLLWFPIVVFACFLFADYAWPALELPVPDGSVTTNGVQAPPLDPVLWKRCITLLPPPKGLYSARVDRLVTELNRAHPAVWIAEPGASVEYFLGAFGVGSWSQSERPFLVAVASGSDEVIILTPKFEEGRARKHQLPSELKVRWLPWSESESPYSVLMHEVGRRALVLDGAVRNFIADGLRSTRHTRDADTSHVLAGVRALRERKSERDIELMRCANKFTLHAIRKTRARMFMGISESATRTILYEEMKYLALSDYGALILFGENAALPHGSGTDRFLQKDEVVLIDAGGKWGGYVSDITRTFALPDSEISDEHLEVWEIVRRAQLAPASLLRLLQIGDKPQYSWLDDRARETVKKGMAALGVPPGPDPDYTTFTHRLGHGIGLEGHEGPYAVQGLVGDRQAAMGDLMIIDTFSPITIPSLADHRFANAEDLLGASSDDIDDLENSLLAMSFLDLDIPTPPSPPQVTLTFPDDWDCRTAIDVAERLAGQSFYTPNYCPEIMLSLQSRCNKIIPYLHRNIIRDRLPKFSALSPSGKPHRQILTERRKLKTLEYLYAQRLQVAHLDAVKSSSPALWGYITQFTAGISYDAQLWARVNAVRQPLDSNHLTLTFPPGWTSRWIQVQLLEHPGPPPWGELSQPKLYFRRDGLPKFSKGHGSSGKGRKLTRIVKSQLLALAFLFGEPLSVAHLNTIERESVALFDYVTELGRVVEEHQHLDAPIADALVGFTLANRTSHSTLRVKTMYSESSKPCVEEQTRSSTSEFEGDLGF